MATLVILVILGLIILTEGLLQKKSWHLPTIFLGLAIALIFTIREWNDYHRYFHEMMVFDNLAVAFSGLMIIITFLIFLFAGSYYSEVKRPLDDIYAIMIFALVGCVMMTCFGNLVMLFLGIETLSISLYILAGSHKEAITSNEATLKYFLMGSFISCFLLFGIVLIFASTGTFNLEEIATYTSTNFLKLSPIFKTGLFLMIAGMAFKIAVFPFHFWAPDVYEGTPTLLSLFMVTVVKIASFIALFRVFSIAFPAIHETWEPLLWIMAVLTIVIGNLTGLYQSSLKRMLAYSSISHSGYMLLAILAFGEHSASALLYYSGAYAVATVIAFAVLIQVRKTRGTDNYTVIEGMAKTNPVEALTLSVSLLSLLGIPPLAGFMGKYFLFSGAVANNFIWLVIIAVIGSAISVGYYFRPIVAIYLKEAKEEKIKGTITEKVILVFLAIMTLLLGLFPTFFISL